MTDQTRVQATDYTEKMEHTRYGRSHRSHRRTLKIIFLSVSLALALLVLVVVSIYSTLKISSLNDLNSNLRHSLDGSRDEVARLKPELASVRNELETLIQGRFPNLDELAVNRVLDTEGEYVKNVVFNIIKQANEQQYKYLLVVENDSRYKVKPGFRVLLFDEYGVHVGTDEVQDNADLNPGESRDYSSDIEVFLSTEPKHFYIEDLTAKLNGQR